MEAEAGFVAPWFYREFRGFINSRKRQAFYAERQDFRLTVGISKKHSSLPFKDDS
jgi:hypothetical protein